jgi:hypothetical protein
MPRAAYEPPARNGRSVRQTWASHPANTSASTESEDRCERMQRGNRTGPALFASGCARRSGAGPPHGVLPRHFGG